MALKTVLDGPMNYNVTLALNFFLGNALVIKVQTTTIAQDDRVSKMKVSSYYHEVHFTTKTSTNLFLLIKNGGSGLLEFATPKLLQKCHFGIKICNLQNRMTLKKDLSNLILNQCRKFKITLPSLQ